jgi:hypothetical protein
MVLIILSVFWFFGFITSILVGFFLIFLVPLFIIAYIPYVYVLHKLIKRRNTHFKRQHFFAEDVLNLINHLSVKKKRKINLESSFVSYKRNIKEIITDESESYKSAALWIILTLTTWLAGLYVYYFLLKDYRKHELNEDLFWDDTRKILADLGVNVSISRRISIIPERSFALYLIASILTFGLFSVYWLYVLIKDPNEHLKHHVIIEDEIIAQLEASMK